MLVAQKRGAFQRRAIKNNFVLPRRRVSTPMDFDLERVAVDHLEFTVVSRIDGSVPEPYRFVEVHVEKVLPEYFVCVQPMKTKPYRRLDLSDERGTILLHEHPIVNDSQPATIRDPLWGNLGNVHHL